jgi:hypothetical protein
MLCGDMVEGKVDELKDLDTAPLEESQEVEV